MQSRRVDIASDYRFPKPATGFCLMLAVAEPALAQKRAELDESVRQGVAIQML